ncbi:hypothetical protein H5410_023560 [Solanum commersonii]|uniref:Uncharacterized protein n=1 Tax=Solanum commersonii TaxID=4109 RepID=A0A9J5ZJ70_SOLCO|nr:hypothetical protein H5410_023560 [Solanum commersonii]
MLCRSQSQPPPINIESTLLSQHLRNTSYNLNCSDVLIQSRLTSIVATILLEVFGGLTIDFAMNITCIFPLLLASNLVYHISYVLEE